MYWAVFAAILLIALSKAGRKGQLAKMLFPRYLACVAAATIALFLYWATRIVGGIYLFNGNFIYVVHLLGWLTIAVLMSVVLDEKSRRPGNSAAIGTVVLAFSSRESFQPGIQEIKTPKRLPLRTPFRLYREARR